MSNNQIKKQTPKAKTPLKIITVSHYSGTKNISETFENVIMENIKRNIENIS